MSANFDPNMGFLYSYTPISPMNQKILDSEFDMSVHNDVEYIKMEEKENKLYKRMTMLNLVLFPFYYVFIKFFISKDLAKDKLREANLQWKFLFNKINMNEFKRKMVTYDNR